MFNSPLPSPLNTPDFVSAIFTSCSIRPYYAHEGIFLEPHPTPSYQPAFLRLQIPRHLWDHPILQPDTGAFQRLYWRDSPNLFSFTAHRPSDYVPLAFSLPFRTVSGQLLATDPLPLLRVCPQDAASHLLLRATWRFSDPSQTSYSDHLDSIDAWAKRITSLPLYQSTPDPPDFFYWHCCHLDDPYGVDYWLVPKPSNA